MSSRHETWSDFFDRVKWMDQAKEPRNQATSEAKLDGHNKFICLCGQSTQGNQHQPCWEPPELDYSSFELIIGAAKELNQKLGRADVAWRTEGMNIVFEQNLLSAYSTHIVDKLSDSYGQRETAFLSSLKSELDIDTTEVASDARDVVERHGKSHDAFQTLIEDVMKMAMHDHPKARLHQDFIKHC